METTKLPAEFQQDFSLVISKKQDKSILRQKAMELNVAVFQLTRRPHRLYFRCSKKQWEHFRSETKELDCIEISVTRSTSRRNQIKQPISNIERRMFRLLIAGAHARKKTKNLIPLQEAKPATS